MAYAEIFNGITRDELQAGHDIPVKLFNVNVGANAEIKRGDLLCATAMSGTFSLASSAADASKVLMIAANDYTADSVGGVTQAYTSGVFNRERIHIGASLTSDAFEPELRNQNIHLTSIQDKF